VADYPTVFVNPRSRCFCCFCGELSAGDIASAAEILESRQRGETEKQRISAGLFAVNHPVNHCKFSKANLAGTWLLRSDIANISYISQFVKEQNGILTISQMQD
jgi:hypothetical protein